MTLSKLSTTYLKRSFSYRGAMLSNNLPKSFKNAASVDHFKRWNYQEGNWYIGFPRSNHVKQLQLVFIVFNLVNWWFSLYR